MASIIASRPWRGYGDLRAMQELSLEQRRLLGPRAPWHSGDLAWGLRQHVGREREWRIRLWEEDGAVVAWSWLTSSSWTPRAGAVEQISPSRSGTVCSRTTRSYGVRSPATVRRPGAMHYNVRDLTEPPEPPALPAGLRYRTVEPDDLAERVAIHRDVWAPSRVTEESYANVTAAWPYRASLDCVVEAPGRPLRRLLPRLAGRRELGRRVEPVGVREEFRRRGLGAAVCTFALQRLWEEGGRQAIVYCVDVPACELYRALGFRRHASLVGYSRA